MRIKGLELSVYIILPLFLFTNIVIAQDVYPPHQFYGMVNYNGQPAPNGLSVVVKINGQTVTSTTTLDGKFGYNAIFYVEGSAGDVVRFFVNGIDTGKTTPFCNGCFNDCDRYNSDCSPIVLSASGPALTTTTTQVSNTGGGGGGGTTITTTTPITTTIITQTTIQGCQEKWSCTNWSPCVNNVQTRTCSDANNCGTDLYKPFGSQPCAIEQLESQKNPLTGLMTQTTTQVIATVIIAALIFMTILGWRIIVRRRAEQFPTMVVS